MAFSPYKVLPYPVNCDTVFLCYNPYYDIQFKQCYQFKDMPSLIEQIPTTYKIILLAQTFDEGIKQIATITRLKQIKEQSRTKESHSQGEDEEDKMQALKSIIDHSSQNKSSFLHLKCMLNKTQGKISRLDKEMGCKIQKQTEGKVDKKTQKYNKIQVKQLQFLRHKQSNLQKELSNQQNRIWWQQQSRRLAQSESEQSCEDLLSDSDEQKKENKMAL